ncbi:hypothetical protein ACVR0S_09860 [Streptococcus dentapri]|uniref:Lipoprotein n=1 Tax=Streptococcus dentapri TaxID=573564 RepID=A0ABV8D0D0_9STRE
MKKSTKITLISLAALAILAGIGGSLMVKDDFNSRFEAFVKAKREQQAKEAEKKQREAKMTIKEKQLAYLKEHQQEIVDFVKSQNSRIESVQINWKSMKVEQSGNGTPQGGGYNLSLSGKFNNLENTKFTVDFYLERKDDIPDVEVISMLNPPMIDEGNIWDVYGEE